MVAGQITIPKGADLAPTKPDQVPADAFSSVDSGGPPNMYVPLTGPQTPVPAGKLTPEQKLALYQLAVNEYKKNASAVRPMAGLKDVAAPACQD